MAVSPGAARRSTSAPTRSSRQSPSTCTAPSAHRYDLRNERLGDTALIADVWFAHSDNRGRSWRQTHVACPTDLNTAPLPAHNFVGEYQGLAGLRRGFAAAFTLAAPQAKDGRTDIFFAGIKPGLIAGGCRSDVPVESVRCVARGTGDRRWGSPILGSGIVGSFEEQGWKLAARDCPDRLHRVARYGVLLAGLVLLLG